MVPFLRLILGLRLGRKRPYVTSLLLLEILTTISIADSGQLGCFSPSTPYTLTVAAAGPYSPASGGMMTCRLACGSYNVYTFAGLTTNVMTNMTYCLCSNASLPAANLEDANSCRAPCSDGEAQCGENNRRSVHQVAMTETNVTLIVDDVRYDKVLEINQPLTFTVVANNLENILLDANQGLGPENVTNPAHVTLYITGKVTFTIVYMDKTHTIQLGTHSEQYLVEASVQSVVLTCPDYAVTHEPFICEVTMSAGTSMIATINYGDSNIETFYIADVPVIGLGPSMPMGELSLWGSTISGEVYIMEETVCAFSTNSVINEIQFHAATTGTLKIVRFQWSTCDCISCTDNTNYSIPQQTCVFTSGSQYITVDRSTWLRNKASEGMYIPWVAEYSVSATGFQSIPFNPPMEVDRCHFLAWQGDITFKLSTHSQGSSQSYTESSPLTQTSIPFTKSLNSQVFVPLIRAITSKPSFVKTSHTYVSPGTLDLQISINNSFLGTTALNQTTVQVLEGIDQIIIVHSDYEEMGKQVPFYIEPHTGSNVTYVWDFGDGSVNIYPFPNITYNYTNTGTYDINVTAYNLISSKQNKSTITIEIPIKDFVVTAPQAGSTKEDHPFLFSMSQGYPYDCTWDFGDGSPNDITNETTTPNTPTTWFHRFSDEKTYTTIVICANNLNSKNVTINVIIACPIVNNGSSGINIITNGPLSFKVDSREGSQARVWFTTPDCMPQDTWVTLNWGDGYISPKQYNQTGAVIEHFYKVSGTFDVLATFSFSSGDEQMVKTTLAVITAISNPQIFPNPMHAIINQEINFCITLDSGDNVTLEIDYGDGHRQFRQRSAESPFEEDCVSHLYTSIGRSLVNVKMTNPVTVQSITYVVMIQQPVKEECFDLIQNPSYSQHPNDITLNLRANPACILPTNASLRLLYGDGRVSDTEVFSEKSWTFSYSAAGVYYCYVEIFNLASNANIYTDNRQCLSLAPITHLQITAMSQPLIPIGGPLVKGYGPGNDIFILNEEVIFPLEVTGTVLEFTCQVIHEDLSPFDICDFTDYHDIRITFTKAGKYDIKCTVSNPIGSKAESLSITIVEVPANITITDSSPVAEPKIEKVIQVCTGVIGPDSCFMVDFGDGSSVYSYGDQVTCQNAEQSTDFQGPWLDCMNLRHVYEVEGMYSLTVCGYSTVLPDQKMLCEGVSVIVSEDKCTLPDIKMKNPATLFYQPVKHYKIQEFDVNAEINLGDCVTGIDNVKKWHIAEVRKQDGTVIREFDMTEYRANFSYIHIPQRKLDIGLYKFTITVTLEKSSLFSSSLTTYVEVVRSPLVAGLVQGIATRGMVGCNDYIVLDPLQYSYDPDIEDKASRSDGITCELMCKKFGESWLLDSQGQPKRDRSKASVPYTEAQLNDPDFTSKHPDQGGCFRQGPGLVNMTDCRLEFSASILRQNETYEFHLTVFKDSRSAASSYQMSVVCCSDLPSLAICYLENECVWKDKALIVRSPTNGVRLLRCCPNNDCSNADHEWSVFLIGKGDSLIDNLIFDECIKGSNSEEVFMSQCLFRKVKQVYGEYQDFRVLLKVKAPSGCAVAEVYTDLKVNIPPTPGICSINPKNGTHGVTRFTIGTSGWTDSDGLGSMSIVVKYKLGKEERTNIMYSAPRSFYQWSGFLVSGVSMNPLQRESQVSASVLVTDNIKGTTECKMGDIMMIAPDASSASELEFNTKRKSASLNKRLKEGDVEGINRLVQELAILYGSKRFMVDGDEKEMEKIRSDIAVKMEDLVKAMVYDVPIPTTPEKLAIHLSTMLSFKPDELTLDSQESVISSLSNASQLLKSMPVSNEQVVEIAGLLIQGVSICWQGIRESRKKPLNVDEGRARASPYHKVDNSYSSSQNIWDGVSKDEADKELMAYTLNEKINDQVQKMIEDTMTCVENIVEAIMDTTVPGEEPTEFKTEDSVLKLESNSVENMTNRTSKVAFGISVSIPSIPGLGPSQIFISVQFVLACNIYVQEPVSVITAPVLIQDVYIDRIKITLEDHNCSFVMVFDEPESPTCFSNVASQVNSSNTTDITITQSGTTSDYTTAITQSGTTSDYTTGVDGSSHAHFDRRCVGLKEFGWNTVFPKGFSSVTVFLEPEELSACFEVRIIWKKVITYRGRTAKYKRKVVSDRSVCADALSTTDMTEYEFSMGGKANHILIIRVVQHQCGSGCSQPLRLTGGFVSTFKTENCASRDNKGKKPWQTHMGSGQKKRKRYGVVCEWTHLSAFGGAFAVQPNTIDWEYVFENLDFFKNATLYVTEIIILIIYIAAAVWARRADKKDVEKLGLMPLKDNKAEDKYLYEIHVATGKRRNAGTESNAFLVLSGEFDESDVHRIAIAGKKKLLQRGGNDRLLLSTARPLGSLNYLRVWHDNSGNGKFASWMLKHIVIQDLQTKEKFFFICDQWLAVEMGDGQVDRVLPVAGPEQLTEFGHLFSHNTGKNLSDEHLWYSVIARPPTSRFTRLQRVSCCLLLLYTNMLANALFYRQVKSGTANTITLGPFALSLEQLYVGMVTNLIIFPINFSVVFLFRKSPPRSKRKSRVVEALTGMDQNEEHVTEQSNASLSPSQYSTTGINVVTKPQDKYHRLEKTERSKKKKFRLPWWFKIVAWILLWLGVLTSAAFVTFFGIMFGDRECKKWISSMVVSFATSILLTQPIQVLLFAMMFSLLFKKPSLGSEEEEEDEEDYTLQKDEEWEVPDPEDGYLDERPRTIGYSPPSDASLNEAREVRTKELRMYDVIREIIFYCIFLWLLLAISYQFRPSTGYAQKKEVKTFFIDQGLSNVPTFKYNLMKVTTHRQFWDWLNHTYLPSILATTWYNGDWLPSSRGYLQDRTNRIMGFSTLRQLRTKKSSRCAVPAGFEVLIEQCNDEYDIWNEENSNYGVGWTLLGPNDTADPRYTFRRGSEMNSYPFWARHGFYGGGGYVVNLTGNMQNMQNIVDKLREDRWIDKYTRAVFIEFTTYNPGVNLFSIVTIVGEFVASGGIFPMFRVEPISLLSYYGPLATFEIFCQVSYGAFILFFLIKEARNIMREGKMYFTSFWNWVEILIVILSIAGAGVFAYRLILINGLSEEFKRTQGYGYMKFQYVGYWQELLLYIIGCIVFLANIKFLKLLRFNRRISLLASTLRVGAYPLLMFFFMFGIMFAAHVQYFYFVYLRELNNFKSLINSAETCVQMLLGRFNFEAMSTTSRYVGSLGFLLYVIGCVFILLNMFLTILNESFARVRQDISLQSNDYEMVDFMVHRFKCIVGMDQPIKPGQIGRNEHREAGDPDSLVDNLTEGARNERSIEKFPEKVDRLLKCVSKIIFFENLQDKIYYDQEKLEDILGLNGATAGSDGKAVLRSMQSKENMQRALAKMLLNANDPSNLDEVQKDFYNI